MTASDARAVELQELGARLGVAIKDASLFDRALTHASLVAESEERVQDYESLEFLGDAVLGLAAAHHLFACIPDRRPGEYSRMRAGLVNRRCVARVGRALNIAPHIRLGKGEEQSGGRHRAALVSDCMEALIGAIYLDSGWSVAQAFVIRVFEEEFSRTEWKNTSWDYKSRLQNHCQANRVPVPQFNVVRAAGPDHKKTFEVEVLIQGEPKGRGTGSTKKEAEQRAARAALENEGIVFE